MTVENRLHTKALAVTMAVAAVIWVALTIVGLSSAQGVGSSGGIAWTPSTISAARELRPSSPATATSVLAEAVEAPVSAAAGAVIPASAPAQPVAVQSSTGDSTNAGSLQVAGGNGGPAGPAQLNGSGNATISQGGASIGVGETGGGAGGNATSNVDPTAVSGNSGASQSSSSATNTGDTGDASSSASSSPVATSGSSGATGEGGSSASDPVAVNTGITGGAGA